MKTNTSAVPDGYTTIPQAMKRLGDQAPARQSFYNAVSGGKIEKFTTENGGILVLWASVLQYIEGGGFKRRGQRGAANLNSGGTATTPLAENHPAPTPADPSAVQTAAPAAAPAAAPVATPVASAIKKNQIVKLPIHPRGTRNRKKGHMAGPSRPAKTPQARHPDSQLSVEERRRRLRLRGLKNDIRGLNFDESKNLRDWIDNRLLHVLRPDKEPSDV